MMFCLQPNGCAFKQVLPRREMMLVLLLLLLHRLRDHLFVRFLSRPSALLHVSMWLGSYPGF